MKKFRLLLKRIGAFMLTLVTLFTSMNLSGIGMSTAYAQYQSGTHQGLREVWTGGGSSTYLEPGSNSWLLRYTSGSTSGSNYDYAYSNGGTISDTYYSGYILRRKAVSLTCKIDFSNVSYIEFDMIRRSSDAGDGIMFSAISDSLYNSYIYPASGGDATASASTMQTQMKNEIGSVIYKTTYKDVKETKTYNCASVTGYHYLTMMNYADGDDKAPLNQISEIRIYGTLPTYSNCHVTAATMSGTTTVDYGGSTTFTAVPSGGSYNPSHLRYQWYDNGNGSSHIMSGKTSNYLTITGNENSNGHTYYCQVYADNDTAGYAASGGWCSKKLTVNEPSFTANLGTSATVGYNGTTNLNVSGKNYGTIQWQRSTDNETTWNNVGTGASIAVKDTNGNTSGIKYRAALIGVKTIYSNVCTMSVAEPSYSTNLATTANMTLNGSATLSVGAANYSTVKWQKSKDGTNWSDAGSTTTAITITDSNGSQHNMKYRAVITGTTSVNSNVCTVTVASPAVTAQPQNVTVDEDSTASFVVTASNASAYQWQESENGGSSWKDISGANKAVLNVTSVTMEMNDNKYRCIVSSGVGSATSSAASLTVNELKPVILSQPSDLSIIEGRTVSFVVNPKYYRAVQWQKSTDNGATWKDIEGATSPTYIQYEADLSQNGEKYRAVVKNLTMNTTSEEATLKVNSKKFIGFYVEYPASEVNFKGTLKASDVFVIFRYDNGDASFGKNVEGLTFDGNKTELYMDELGEHTINCHYPGMSKVQSFVVKVVDNSAPEIEEIDISWENEEFTGTNLSNDKDKKIIITAGVKDNSDDSITYQWSLNGAALNADGNVLKIDGNNGNGIYKVVAKDKAGNSATRFVTVNAWDFIAPKIKSFEITPTDAWAAYRSIKTVVTDDCGLNDSAFSYDGGKSWHTGDTMLVDRNGEFSVMVRDMAGNVTSSSFTIENIDRTAPEIESINRLEEDGNVYVTIEAKDETSEVLYGYKKKDGDISWQKNGKFLIENDNDRDKAGRTFYAKDDAGNVSSTKVFINSEYIDLPKTEEEIKSTMYMLPSDTWVNEETGVTLGFKVVSQNSIANMYHWSNEADDTNNDFTKVFSNGNYSATVFTTDGNGNKDSVAATLNYEVSNIDAKGPAIEASETGRKLSIKTEDSESGVDRVFITGGGYSEETLISVAGGNAEDICEADMPVNGVYTVRAVDSVGNETSKQVTVSDVKTLEPKEIIKYITIKPETEEDGEDSDIEDPYGYNKKGKWKNGYTNGNVVINISIPDELKDSLAERPYSWDDGMTWSDDPSFTAKENGIYHLWIKLVDGTIIKCPDIYITCIDRDAPILNVMGYDMHIYVYAKDEKCGMEKVTLLSPDGNIKDIEGKLNDDGSFEAEFDVTTDGVYTITAYDGLDNNVSKEVSVQTRLIKIITPDDIKGVKNGTAADATAMGLPKTVKIVTNNATLTDASVTWCMDEFLYGTSYDPENVDKQYFVIRGYIDLPEYVNTAGVSLDTQISVEVDESTEDNKRKIEEPADNPVDPKNPDKPGDIDSDKYGKGKLSIKIDNDKFTYTGSQIRPKVSLSYTYYTQNGKKKKLKMKANKHYTVVYTDNVNVGTATITIRGIGDFEGEIEKHFTIEKKSINKCSIKGLSNIVYGTDPSKLHPVVRNGKLLLVEGRDYTMEAESVADLNLLGFKYKKIKITITANENSNFKGSKTTTIKIVKRSLNNLMAVKITAPDTKLVNGVAIPKLSVTYNGMLLKEGRDYTVTYKNNKRTGKATAIIKGHGNYGGSRSVKFNVIS